MALHESAEMYLETIYKLSQSQASVRSIDIAEALGYSRPSISRAVGLLKNSGHLDTDQNGFLVLTPSGRTIAENIYTRHRTLEQALLLLGVAPETAEEDACRIEHVISEESLHAIEAHIAHYSKKSD